MTPPPHDLSLPHFNEHVPKVRTPEYKFVGVGGMTQPCILIRPLYPRKVSVQAESSYQSAHEGKAQQHRKRQQLGEHRQLRFKFKLKFQWAR